MPIEIHHKIDMLSQEQYHVLNHRILGIAFAIHNNFGRFLSEELFKREIEQRCLETKVGSVAREVRIKVFHENFCKDYSLDLLIADGLMLEVKTCETISPIHRSQAYNYLLLSGMSHGTLINLRSDKVQHEYISTQLTSERRHNFAIISTRWEEVNQESLWMKAKLECLLADWGAFLEVNLYRDAITFFLGGPEQVYKPVTILSENRMLGTQKFHLLTPDVAFAFSAVSPASKDHEMHLVKMLHHTELKHIQWVNLDHHKIEFTTLSK